MGPDSSFAMQTQLMTRALQRARHRVGDPKYGALTWAPNLAPNLAPNAPPAFTPSSLADPPIPGPSAAPVSVESMLGADSHPHPYGREQHGEEMLGLFVIEDFVSLFEGVAPYLTRAYAMIRTTNKDGTNEKPVRPKLLTKNFELRI